MKYVLNNRIFLMCYIIAIVFGIYIGYTETDTFIISYATKFSLVLIRYIIMGISIIISYYVFKYLSSDILILRKKNMFNAMFYIVKIEIILVSILMLLVHIPVLLLNFSQFFENFWMIFKIFINSILVLTFINSLIRIINLFTKNYAFACGSVLIAYCLLDFIVEHLNWFSFLDNVFDFGYIFILPYLYKDYYLMFIILIFLLLFFNSCYTFYGIKKDYFLKSESDEKD